MRHGVSSLIRSTHRPPCGSSFFLLHHSPPPPSSDRRQTPWLLLSPSLHLIHHLHCVVVSVSSPLVRLEFVVQVCRCGPQSLLLCACLVSSKWWLGWLLLVLCGGCFGGSIDCSHSPPTRGLGFFDSGTIVRLVCCPLAPVIEIFIPYVEPSMGISALESLPNFSRVPSGW